MKLFVIFFSIVFLFSFGNTQSNIDLDEELHLSVSIYKYKDSHRKKIKSVVSRLSSAIERELKIKFVVSYITNVEDEIDSFINYDKSNVIIIYTSTYLENKELLKKYSKNPFFVSGDGGSTQYYLVASKNSNIKKLKDIKGKKFITFKGYDYYTMWLDFLSLKELNIPYKRIISSSGYTSSINRLLLDVYFNKYDFTVVTKKVYDDMVLLNPALKKELIIIRKSKKIFQNGLGLIHKRTPQKIVDKMNEIIESNDFEDEQADIMSLINRGKIEKFEYKKLDDLEVFWNEYKKLKEKSR